MYANFYTNDSLEADIVEVKFYFKVPGNTNVRNSRWSTAYNDKVLSRRFQYTM